LLLRSFILTISLFILPERIIAQLSWQNVDSLYQPLPASVHVYKTTDSINGKPNIAYYVVADLKDRKLKFTVDTSYKRRLTPSAYYEKNNQPLLVVNSTFFSFATNQNLNIVIRDGKLISYNNHSMAGKGKDTLTYRHPFAGAIGISRKRTADIAWTYTNSKLKRPYAIQFPVKALKDSSSMFSYHTAKEYSNIINGHLGEVIHTLKKWKMQTVVGGGPVLLQNGEIRITNNEEEKFTGKAINDKHPRTAIGYTSDQKLIILVVQGRFPGIAEGATLTDVAEILQDLQCNEALNLDGGGSSCLLINGKQTIQTSDKQGQRSIPSVFLIQNK